MKKYLLFEIGCIECGCSSSVVGVFDKEEEALRLCEILKKEAYWRDGGQNKFEIFPLDKTNKINPEFNEFLINNK